MLGLGFRKVSKTQWKREGDRVIWRVAVAQTDKNWRGWIEVEYGLEVPGFDDLVMQIIGDRPSERLNGTSARVHYLSSVSADLIGSMREDYERRHPPRSGFKGWLADTFKGRQPKFHQLPYDIPFYEEIGGYPGGFGHAWATEGNEPAELARLLAGHFERHTLPFMDSVNDIRTYYEREYGPNCLRPRHTYWPRVAIASMVGDQNMIDRIANDMIRDATMSYEEGLAQSKEWVKQNTRKYHPSTHFTPHEQTVISRLGAIAGCRVLYRAAEVCGFTFDDPGIDFALLEKAEEQFGDDCPSFSDARALQAKGIDWTDGYY